MHLPFFRSELLLAGMPIANFVPTRLKMLGDISENLGLADLVRLFARNVLRINHYYVLYLTLADLPSSPPKCLGGLPPLLLGTDDLHELYERLPRLVGDDRLELMSRLSFYKSGFKNCYRMSSEGSIAYLQWLILPSENDVIKTRYKRKFLPLNAKEVLIENSFTFPEFRGRGFLPFGTWHLLATAKQMGYKRAVVYIRKDRIDPLNRFMHFGFF